MFDMLSNLAGLMKNAHLIQGRMKELKERLKEMRVEAASEQGLVRVIVTGELTVFSITISPEISSDTPRVEALLEETLNRALIDARERAAREMAALTDGLGVPGLSQLVSKIGIGMN
ncbi:MAG TPA: YbaB/EbfC family nucleoid-associated protein [Planctomicrobium sp.]|nr:YbaB/EbfC family nucleoid-associated protein [Planctomicrobium sp.]